MRSHFTIIAVSFILVTTAHAQQRSCLDGQLLTMECSKTNLSIIDLAIAAEKERLLHQYTDHIFTNIEDFKVFRSEVVSLARAAAWSINCKKQFAEYRYNPGICRNLFPAFWKASLKTHDAPIEYHISVQSGWFHSKDASPPPEDACVVTFRRGRSPHEGVLLDSPFSFTITDEGNRVQSAFFVKDANQYSKAQKYYNSLGDIDEIRHFKPDTDEFPAYFPVKYKWRPRFSVQTKRHVVANGAFEFKCDQFYSSDFSYACAMIFTDKAPNELSPGVQVHQKGEHRTVIIEDQREAKELWDLMSQGSKVTSGHDRTWTTPAGDSVLTCAIVEGARVSGRDTGEKRYVCRATYAPAPASILEY